MKNTKTKERVAGSGEVFTPLWLANEMLSLVEREDFVNPKSTFFDPACGNGNLLVPIIYKKLQQGCTPWEALSTTFGVDIMVDNVKECRKRLMQVAGVTDQKYMDLLKTTIVRGNTMEDSVEDLFSRFTARYGEALSAENK